jgi:hypothetical protein
MIFMAYPYLVMRKQTSETTLSLMALDQNNNQGQQSFSPDRAGWKGWDASMSHTSSQHLVDFNSRGDGQPDVGPEAARNRAFYAAHTCPTGCSGIDIETCI